MNVGPRYARCIGIVVVSLSALTARPSLARINDFQIRPQSLATALREFGLQSGVSIVYDFPLASRMRSPGVTGRLDDAEALDRLLRGNRLKAVPVNGGYVLKLTAESAPRKVVQRDRNPEPPLAHDRPDTVEILVTAQKRSERLLDVPMSISVASRDRLVAAGVSSTGDLQQLTAGLVTPSVGLAFTPAIRGVTTVSTSPGDETNIALYLDDVYIGAPIAGLLEFKDVERIEVLKGPQGTLFGRNATGGAIRIITAPPSDSFKGELSSEYGFNFNQVKLGGFVTGPLGSVTSASLGFNYSNDNGYIRGIGPNTGRRFGRNRSYGGRTKLRIVPTDDLTMTFAADATSRADTSIYAFVPRDRRSVHESNPAAVIPRPFEYSGSTSPIADLDAYGASLDAHWDRDDVLSVRSITAYRSVFGSYQTDLDRINLSLGALRLKQNQRNFSQEVVFSTPAERPISMIGGLYYYHSRAFNPYFESHTTDSPNGPIGQSFTNNVLTNAYAAFGEATIHPGRKLHLTLGARYTTEAKQIDYRFLVRAAGLLTGHGKENWKSPTFRGVVRYNVAPDANIYFSASNGFKSGVYNAYAFPLVAVKPERIDAFEIGAKARIAGLSLSAAGFLYNYRNIQVQGQTPFGNIFLVTLTNAARARIRGFEASMGGRLGTHLSVNLSVSALPTARYSSFTIAQVFIPAPATGGNTNVVPFDATGSRTIRSPKWQGNARVIYRSQNADGGFEASASYAYNDGYYFQPGNLSFQKAYHVVNARVAWTDPSRRFTFSVSGQNLTDETYSFYTTDSLAGTVDVLARPRELSAGVAVKF